MELNFVTTRGKGLLFEGFGSLPYQFFLLHQAFHVLVSTENQGTISKQWQISKVSLYNEISMTLSEYLLFAVPQFAVPRY